MIFHLAWKNVWRNKTRSSVIIIAVILGLWGGIFSDAFMQGMSEQQINSSIQTETGHIQLNAPGYLLNHDMQIRIADAGKLESSIRRLPAVQAVAGRIQLTAMASTATSSAGILINGMDPDELNSVSDLSGYLTEGEFFPGKLKNEALIGQGLADKLHCKLHSRVVLTLQTYTGEITYASIKISGIFKSHNSEFDKQMVFLRKSDLSALINFPSGAVSMVTVLLKETDETEPVISQLRKQYPQLQVQSWIELSPMIRVITGTMRQTSLIFVGIILIALAFGIVNTMLMAVMDRTKEIGMLMSIGMRPRRIFGLILLETILLSLTGAVMGVLLSVATISYFGHKGINLAAWAEGINAWGYSAMVYPTLGVDFYIELTVMVILIALMAGIFPARRAIRLKPAEAVRGD